ncbi:PREDICTED: protocadherin alpha-C2-like isoform X7 [Nanorana parkeri]|uniref:protocadherin alpha-C2-like isoform X7 n=1 Tax=Nanorana parkeri TaxID=125878 RepID=UPI000854D2A7|nr:PREDICTED: protocadherin alpha-C2-like isoform X7 [Nanorana parkeri]
MAFTRRCVGLISLALLTLVNVVTGQLRYSVREELNHGAFVGNVINDLGLDLKQLPTRSFSITSGNNQQYFDVNLGNGVLFVNRTIDREALCPPNAPCVINLGVVIGNPVEVHNIEVEILDINDHAPRFPRNEYYLNISESAMPGARFPIESALDPDIGSNSIQTYKLNDNNYFALDLKTFNGNSKLIEIVLKKSLDREQRSLHQLVLTAIDGGNPAKSGTAQILVYVMDTNDNNPFFDKSTYKASLLENSPTGTLVVKLNASDPDEGSNGEVAYSFSGYTPQKVRQLFTLDAKSGEVRVNGPLDFEKSSSYEIYVQATDKGPVPMAGHCKVLVEIIDANDNAPEIVVTSNYSPVAENSQEDTVVALMSVTDQDSGINKEVSLTIQQYLPFKLKSFKNTYKLVTDGKLDREKCPSYNITVTATDSGNPPLSSQKTLYVEISDVNDNPPVFEESSYSMYVLENNAPGVSLFSVKAMDPDSNENAFVSYMLLQGDAEGLPISSYVSVKSDNGTIYAVQSFDYEKLREFRFVPKHPNPDWRYSASLKAAMQGAVHMEGAAVLRGAAVGLEQQWPTVSSATPVPEGGEVSPPVGAGVNCNSWTFKYGPGNQKQQVPQIPPDFPENFIIPGSPAIISIRQDQPSAQAHKSNFITFGKKEETKKKKKKKKGNKNQEKANNNAADNNDQ